MRLGRKLSVLLLAGVFEVSLPMSTAFAATAVQSDLTDFVTRLGGYVFPATGPASNTQFYWSIVSYTMTPAAAPSNITKIVMTKMPLAAVYKLSGNGTASANQPAAGTAIGTQLNPCTAQNYVVETVTLDLRDLELVTPAPTQGNDNGHLVWSVVLQTSSGANFIRQNTQTLPANCYATGFQPASSVTQMDVSQYTIVFGDSVQAKQFVRLLNNVIPTLNPPVLIGP
jgi:hypothetical protein